MLMLAGFSFLRGVAVAVASPKPCAQPACSALVYDGSGWCEKHKRVDGKFSDAHRGSRHQRGYGSEWDKQRRRVLERDNYLCQVCMKKGWISRARQVDHVLPKAFGGSDDDDNLQSICVPCHKAKTALEGNMGRGLKKG
jgi:5-methylcytosine-specific restriction protein A